MSPQPVRKSVLAPSSPALPLAAGLSVFGEHCQKWKDGCGSDICAQARRRCFARGKIPCDILMVGEAPGASEDAHGEPFVGPAGHLLDHIIYHRAKVREFRMAYTNLVLCIPRGEEGTKTGAPEPEAIANCAPRLVEFIEESARPRLIVCVGTLSRDHLIIPPDGRRYKHTIHLSTPVPTIDIIHPAAILRAPVAQKEFLINRAAVILANAVEEYLK